MKSLLKLGLLGAIIAMMPRSSAEAYCLMTTESSNSNDADGCVMEGELVRWRRPCIALSLDDRGSRDLDSPRVRAAIERSFRAWMEIDCGGGLPAFNVRLNDATTRCQYAGFDFNGPNANTIAFVDNFEEEGYDATAFAVTIVWYSVETGEIFDGDLLINEDFVPYTICPDSGCEGDEIDLINVLTHEAGHFFGLAHSDVIPATMYRLAPRGEIEKRSLHPDDREGFCALYSEPLNPSCSFSPIGGLADRCAGDAPPPTKNGRCDASGGEFAGSLLPLAFVLFLYRLWLGGRIKRALHPTARA